MHTTLDARPAAGEALGQRGSVAAGVPLDWRVVAFTALVSLLVGLLFSLVPAWRAVRVETAVAIFNSDHKLVFYNAAFAKLWSLDNDWLATHPIARFLIADPKTSFQSCVAADTHSCAEAICRARKPGAVHRLAANACGAFAGDSWGSIS